MHKDIYFTTYFQSLALLQYLIDVYQLDGSIICWPSLMTKSLFKNFIHKTRTLAISLFGYCLLLKTENTITKSFLNV